MEKEKRDKEMKGAVDRLWQHYFADAGKIRSKAEAREGGSTRRSVQKMQTKAAAEEAACTQEEANAVSRIRGRVDAQRQRRSLGSGASLLLTLGPLGGDFPLWGDLAIFGLSDFQGSGGPKMDQKSVVRGPKMGGGLPPGGPLGGRLPPGGT